MYKSATPRCCTIYGHSDKPCHEWLKDYLADHGGRVSTAELRNAAPLAGFVWTDLKRAKRRLRLVSIYAGPGEWDWVTSETAQALREE